MTHPGVAFSGFRSEAIQFLADLAANNDRTWFQPRKAEYERLLKEPMEALCAALDERFAARGLPFAADPARSPFRIYRDVRFAKDKSPYKTHVAASFPFVGERGRGSAAQMPAVRGAGAAYFHVGPGEVFAGGGIYHPEPGLLRAWRRLVDGDPARVRATFDEPAFVATFGSVGGHALTRVPAGFRSDHPEADLLKLTDVVFGRSLSDEDASSPKLPDLLADTYAAAVPVFAMFAGLEH